MYTGGNRLNEFKTLFNGFEFTVFNNPFGIEIEFNLNSTITVQSQVIPLLFVTRNIIPAVLHALQRNFQTLVFITITL